jgi:8-oxo-dGTP diphosphatase
VVITNDVGEVLLVRRTYPPFDWVLPGGLAEDNESPTETALREVREETGLELVLDRMTGVYYQADHRSGEFLHFMFAARMPPNARLVPQASEVADPGFYDPANLPEPMSPSTRRRLLDAMAEPSPTNLPVRLEPGSEPR